MADRLVGRDPELTAAARALADRGVLLDGEAGIGKTTMWRQLVADLEAGGVTVLRAAPTEAERQLPYAALADILRDQAEAVADLPPPQAAAAQAVMVSADISHPVDERTVAVMVWSVLAAVCARDVSAVLAIDDCPWLDAPSERALRYALRRLDPGPRLLLTQRGHGEGPLPLGLDESSPQSQIASKSSAGDSTDAPPSGAHRTGFGPPVHRGIVRIIVPRLGIGALHHVIQQHLGVTLNRPLLTRLTVESEGNPMLAIDLARAVLRLPALPRPDEDLPVARSVSDLIGQTLRTLPQRTATALRFVALLTTPTEADLRAVGIDPGDLDPAERAGLVERRVGPRFCHPLHATAVRADIPDGLRRKLQLRLAAALTDPDERARQLAAALLVGAVVAFVTEGHVPAVRLAEIALRHADPDGEVAGRIFAHLTVFDDRPEAAIGHGARALALIPDDDDRDHRDMRVSAMLMVFYNKVRAGRPPRLELLDRAVRLEGDQPSWLAGSVPGLWWTAVDDHVRARARMDRQLDHARAAGDEPVQLEVLLHLVQSLMLDGRWDSAERHLAQARALGEQLGGGLDEQDYLQAQLGIYRGDLDRYGSVVTAGLERTRREGDSWGLRVYGVLDGQLALHSGDHRRAARSYAALAETMSSHGLVESLALRWEPDWIESCVGAGDLETATEVLRMLAERHRRLPRPWTSLGLARSRVLVLAAQGADTVSALAELDATLAAHPAEVLPLDRARCLLVAGMAHRRARRRGRAQELLSAAVAEFEALGARAFAARARAELERPGPMHPAHPGRGRSARRSQSAARGVVWPGR